MPFSVNTAAWVDHEVCCSPVIFTVSESCAKSPAAPLALVLTVEASTPMRTSSKVVSPLRSVMPICSPVAVAGVPPPPAVSSRLTLPIGVSVTTDWQRSVRLAESMLAIATACGLPAVSLATPAYCEKPVPSSSVALILNWLPEMANETGTAPFATPPMTSTEATATGTAASRMRPACDAVSVRSFIDPLRSAPARV